MPPEGATEAELEQHRIAKMVDGLIDRKVKPLVPKGFVARCVDQVLFVVTPCVCMSSNF